VEGEVVKPASVSAETAVIETEVSGGTSARHTIEKKRTKKKSKEIFFIINNYHF